MDARPWRWLLLSGVAAMFRLVLRCAVCRRAWACLHGMALRGSMPPLGRFPGLQGVGAARLEVPLAATPAPGWSSCDVWIVVCCGWASMRGTASTHSVALQPIPESWWRCTSTSSLEGLLTHGVSHFRPRPPRQLYLPGVISGPLTAWTVQRADLVLVGLQQGIVTHEHKVNTVRLLMMVVVVLLRWSVWLCSAGICSV